MLAVVGIIAALTACSTPPPQPPPEQGQPATASMPGHRLASTENEFVRVFDDHAYQTVYEFPATMTGCDHGRFVVRWRTTNPDAVVSMVPVWAGAVEFGMVGPLVLIPVDGTEVQTGTSGRWESRSKCEQPSWVLLDAGGDGVTLTDVVVEYEVWVAVS